MKKNYEKTNMILGSCLIFFIIIFLCVLFSFNKTVRTYDIFSAVVINNNSVELIVSDYNYENIKRATFLYINNIKKDVEVHSLTRYILRDRGRYYHHLILSVYLDGNFRPQENLSLVVSNGSKNLFSLLINSIWEE